MTTSSTPKPPRAAVIITQADQLLLLYRYKNGRTYYVIPGGTLEPDETLTQAAVREVKEETGLEIALAKKLWTYDNNGRLEHYFLATTFSGTLQLGGPELAQLSADNIYRPEWTSLAKLPEIPLVPEAIKMRILQAF